MSKEGITAVAGSGNPRPKHNEKPPAPPSSPRAPQIDVGPPEPEFPYLEIEFMGLLDEDGEEVPEVAIEGREYIKNFWAIYVRDREGLAVWVADRDTEEEIREFYDLLVDAARPDIKLRDLWAENDERLT